MHKKLDFKLIGGAPITVEVEKDGQEYTVNIGIAILGVEDMEQTGPNGLPVFTVKANFSTLVEKK